MTEFMYRHFDAAGRLLYVGISCNALHRLSQHRRHSSWFPDIARVEISRFETREAAVEAEKTAIREEKPSFNIVFNPMPFRGRISEDLLTGRIVRFKPTHSIEEVAQALGATTSTVKDLIRSGELGHVELPGPRRNDGRFRVTGWQLIDYLERLEEATQDEEDVS